MSNFKYSSYWGTWSRILCAHKGEYIELNITGFDGKLELMEKIRVHHTQLGKKDMICDQLPDMIYQRLQDQNVGVFDEFLLKILKHDYLAEVSIDIIRKAVDNSSGGGVPFNWIKEHKGEKFWQN